MCIKGMFVWEDFREEEKLRREQWKESIFSRCLVGREGGSRSKYSCASARLCHFFARLAFYFYFYFCSFSFDFCLFIHCTICVFFFFWVIKKKKNFFSIFLFCVFFLYYFLLLLLCFIFLFLYFSLFIYFWCSFSFLCSFKKNYFEVFVQFLIKNVLLFVLFNEDIIVNLN